MISYYTPSFFRDKMDWRKIRIKPVKKEKQIHENRILDANTLGEDIDYTPFEELGEVVKYPFSTSEEVFQRLRTRISL